MGTAIYNKTSLALLGCALVLGACNDPVAGYFDRHPSSQTLQGSSSNGNDTGTGGNSGGNNGGGGSSSAQCGEQDFQQPTGDITKKIDIAFVIDTSASLNDQRTAIANQIGSFVQQLGSDVDYQVGVLLGHAKSSYAGKFYQKGTEPRILSSQSLSIDQIKTHLKTKMTNGSGSDALPGESFSDGGEAGIASLFKAIGDNYTYNRSVGFFRDGAALAVVFVADENDVCFPGTVPDYDGNEIKFQTEGTTQYNFCKDLAGGTLSPGQKPYELIPNRLMSQLIALQASRPLLMAGILYLDNHGTLGGEQEKGMGYLDVLNGAPNSLQADLSTNDYANDLAAIGSLAQVKLNLITEFTLNLTSIDPDFIQVTVDGRVVPHLYYAGPNQVALQTGDAGDAQSQIHISYCQLGD